MGTTSRPLRNLGFLVILFVGLELAAWGLSFVWPFHIQVEQGLDAARAEDLPSVALAPGDPCSPEIERREADQCPPREDPMAPLDPACESPAGVEITPDRVAQDGSRRIFVVGGSAAFGYPHAYVSTFTHILEEELEPDDFSFYNVAGVGLTSGEIDPVVCAAMEHYAAHTVVIFSGNNEWIRYGGVDRSALSDEALRALDVVTHSRTLSLLTYTGLKAQAVHTRKRDRRSRFFREHAEQVGIDYAVRHPLPARRFDGDLWLLQKQQYLDVFEANLTQMVGRTVDGGGRAVLLTIPFHYKLSPAWKHRQPLAYDIENEAQIESAVGEAADHLQALRLDEAIQVLDQALELEPAIPVLHYLRAIGLEGLGRLDEAEQSYALSREHMIGNLGSVLSINDRIAAVAAATGAELLDARALFDDHSHERGTYFAADLLFDDCHPSAVGHRLLAEAMVAILSEEDTHGG